MTSSSSFESRPLPKTFVLELTRRCNNSCLYCYTVWGAPELGYEPHRPREMSTQEITEVIARLQDETPVETIAVSGGEPLLREDLPEIVSFIDGLGLTPVIITNGTLLGSERVARTMRGTTYEVTLLSHRREVHDFLVGRAGAWDEVVDGMANVTHAGGNLVAVFVATKLNHLDLYKTTELGIALGAYGLMYNRMNLGAYNLRHADRLLPTAAMIREDLQALDKLGEEYALPIAVSVVIEPCVVDVRDYEHIHFGWCPLAGERSYFTIDPAGNVRVCNHSPVILGNLQQDSFLDIYYHHPYVRDFHDTWPAECSDCDPELRELCGGGCKAAAEQCYGTLQRVDPFVTLCRQASYPASGS
ncbi:MAG TPA: radical SAM protein [Anaerolineae bacterium]|nr:radical SAM protein [Anaerolineae bacterium]